MISYLPILQKINSSIFDDQSLSVEVLRLDLIHPEISGNKWFKLKRNIGKAAAANIKTIVTFGGAFSNHIAATAAACKMAGLTAIGIIRGEPSGALNATLLQAKDLGMQLFFLGREQYKQKDTEAFRKEIFEKFGSHHLIPEGGNNEEGVLGCTEIIKPEWEADYILCACGTGATFSGIVGSIQGAEVVVGVSVLKGDNQLPNHTGALVQKVFPGKEIWINGNAELEKPVIEEHCITNNYSFKGYACYDQSLVDFKNQFEKSYQLPLDHVYTTKLFYALFDLVKKEKFKRGSKIVVVHSGGLQGNAGFEARFF